MNRGLTHDDLMKIHSEYNVLTSKENKEYTISETCPHCQFDVELTWDTETDKYVIHCPKCGEIMMLCDACTHAKDNPKGKCTYDSTTGLCFRRLDDIAKKLRKEVVE